MIRKFPIRAAIRILLVVALAVCISRYGPVLRFYARHSPVWGARGTVQPRTEFAAQVVAGARAQIGTVYDSAYVRISYPGGDVPSDRGACSDVVIRALRYAGVDLQRLIHEDMLRANGAYPHSNPSAEPDANIDHRRCLNQMQFFSNHGQTLTTEVSADTRGEWQPGDFVYWRQPGDRRHVGVLSDRINGNSLPLVIHNGSVCIEQDCLTDWEIVGHYRYSPQ
ncbi:DUF1287 domain-containing protein [Verrucomicrobiota bacterium sgz303538]